MTNDSHKQVLVVDDDPLIARLVASAFQDSGFGVETASGGRDAAERLTRNGVDLVVTDLVMPNGHGIELIQAMRETAPDTPVIAMSSDRVHLRTAQALGAARIFKKPFSVHDLVRAARGILRI